MTLIGQSLSMVCWQMSVLIDLFNLHHWQITLNSNSGLAVTDDILMLCFGIILCVCSILVASCPDSNTLRSVSTEKARRKTVLDIYVNDKSWDTCEKQSSDLRN